MKNICCLLVALSSCAFGAEDVKPIISWNTASAGPALIAVPNGWRSFDGIQSTMPIYRQGDGMDVPTVDETGAPVQIGLTVEKFPRETKDTEAIAKEIAEAASSNPDLKRVGQAKFETVTLSDRTQGILITTEFIKAGTRRSYYMKLVAKSAGGDVWVATGYIVAGRDSAWPTHQSLVASWLRAHVVSLTVTGKAVDPTPLQTAYLARDGKQNPVRSDLAAPNFNVTGKWNGTWQESDGTSTETFTMELFQTGMIVKGTAIFMDSTRTRAAVSGEASGSTIRLVMSPPQPVPKTTWTGTVTGGTLAGNWSLRANGSTATGSWSATAETNAANASPKDSP